MRAWLELPPGAGWGDIRIAAAGAEDLGYVTEELRGTGPVLLRLSGSKLDRSALWRRPGQD